MAAKSRPKALSAAANLANLLPTGTVLAFEALVPSFSNSGNCLAAHKYLTLSAIICCSVVCFLSSFTDSFKDHNGKVYYGIATFNGILIFNKDKKHDDDDGNDEDMEMGERERNQKKLAKHLAKHKICFKDILHAFTSLLVFLVFAIGGSDVQRCFFPHAGPNGNALMINLPLGVGALASFVFMIFPTKRRGIGHTDKGPRQAQKLGSSSTPMHSTG